MKHSPALLAALLIGVGTSGCGGVCSNEPIAVIPSPSGKIKAVTFHRNCGPTTKPNTQVSVLPEYASLPNIPGNALILDGDASLQVRWVSNTSVAISGLGSVRPSRKQKSVTGVAIAYEP